LEFGVGELKFGEIKGHNQYNVVLPQYIKRRS